MSETWVVLSGSCDRGDHEQCTRNHRSTPKCECKCHGSIEAAVAR